MKSLIPPIDTDRVTSSYNNEDIKFAGLDINLFDLEYDLDLKNCYAN